jgi:cell fate (sporulation/competence/biofilm development) regulator YlbF (YheA/YmcA/DUF963 family)
VADTNQVMEAATKLGGLIGTHPSVQSYRELTRQMDLDISARTLLGQFEQMMENLAQKEASGMPIEVADKRNVEQLQQSIAIHPLLKKLMAAQVEYMDLMRKVQETINEGLSKAPSAGAEAAPAAAPSKILLD